jgi:hypothetical protein
MRVDEPVVPLWESRTACGRPICPHTSSTDGYLVVHTVGLVVHSYPQTRAQQVAPGAVHRLCTTHRFHSPPGKSARYSAVSGEPPGAVVDPGSPDHADVTTHRSPVDDCGQLDPHAVYEAVFRGCQAVQEHSRGLYPQDDAPRCASLWISVDEAVEDVGRRRVPPTTWPCGTWARGETGERTSHGHVRGAARRDQRRERGAGGPRVGTAGRIDRVDARRRSRETGRVHSCRNRAAASLAGPRGPPGVRGVRGGRRVEAAAGRQTGQDLPGMAGAVRGWAHGDAPQPRCCCLILLVSSVTWL